MNLARRLAMIVVPFCVATVLVETGLLAVLWQRHILRRETAAHLLTVAYAIPVRDILDELATRSRPVKSEMVSFAEVQEARMLSALDLDMRRMAFEKGLTDMRELAVLLDQEKGRYTQVKEGFDAEWNKLQNGATETALRDVQHQIESLRPKAAKDQLLRILDSPDVPPETALNQIVAIFKNMSLENRKKVIAEFEAGDAPRLQDVLRQIRLGMPEVKLLRDTRVRLQEFRWQD